VIFPDAPHANTGLTASPTHADACDERRVFEAVQEFLRAGEAGLRPSRRELLARNPAIADELIACLASLSFLRSAAAELSRWTKNGPRGGGTAGLCATHVLKGSATATNRGPARERAGNGAVG
jgi:hypothetical protein